MAIRAIVLHTLGVQVSLLLLPLGQGKACKAEFGFRDRIFPTVDVPSVIPFPSETAYPANDSGIIYGGVSLGEWIGSIKLHMR